MISDKTVPSKWKKHFTIINGCWRWSASKKTGGYGQVTHLGRCRSAHRVFYEVLRGPIPAGLHIDHLCRNRDCVNPSHMEVVTQAENNARNFWALRTHCKNGHLLSEDNVSRSANRYGRRCKRCHADSEIKRQRRIRASQPPHSTAKITAADAQYIRRFVSSGGHQSEMVRKFALSPPQVSRIVNNTRWKART